MKMALSLNFTTSLLCLLLPSLCILFRATLKKLLFPTTSAAVTFPKSYPFVGSYFSILANWNRLIQWTSDLVRAHPDLTITLIRPPGRRIIFTANPAVVQHILKTRFEKYEKGDLFRSTFSDFLGQGIFNADGNDWKYQRKVSSHEFNTKSLRKFVETVVDTELSGRLIPILSSAAANNTVLDFQDILQRFAFDNICKIAFGYDPEYLLPSLPETAFAVAFDNATRLITQRLEYPVSMFWKIKRALNIGSERKLKQSIESIHEFAKRIVREKKQELHEKSELESVDLLSRFLTSGHLDEKFVADIVISFILAGRDTTSAALTWFFWLLSGKPEVESKILTEIRVTKSNSVSELGGYDEVKDMVYTHASISESMRLYPPVPVDSKEAVEDDVLPDGMAVEKGTRVGYHPYAMGRVEKVWGEDWPEFRPERWLEMDASENKWRFVGRDPYTYPVFQAGPRVCLGKEMAFLQMKRIVGGVLRRFKVVPAMEEGVEPVLVSYLSSRMKGGFPVRIIEREGVNL